jgi:hypothetical protein
MSFLVLAMALGIVPVGGLVYLKWRFRPSRVRADVDRLLADAEARMDKRETDDLIGFVRDNVYLTRTVATSPPAKRIRTLMEKRNFSQLGREWGELWPALLAAEERRPGKRQSGLDHIIDLGAAISVLARRHPA